jgi:hypothetical protein
MQWLLLRRFPRRGNWPAKGRLTQESMSRVACALSLPERWKSAYPAPQKVHARN